MTDARDWWPVVLLRITCGLFFIPHAIGKYRARAAAAGFFEAAGFRPASRYVPIAMCLEIFMATALVLGWHVRPVAWMAGLYLLIATAALIKVTKKWLWQNGGCEYALFWALCCLAVGALA